MALTAINIKTDRKEYSRFEDSRSKIRVRVVPTPATDLIQEQVTLTLLRGAQVIHQQDVILDGDYPKGHIVEIDLNSIVDADGIPTCIRGEYTIQVGQNPILAAETVRVSIITPDAMRAGHCFGAPLYNYETMVPKKQPTLVTGVTIRTVSEKTKTGLYNLAYDHTADTLTWGDGTAIPIGADSTGEILLDTKGNYIEVDIDPFELPAANAAEAILIDREIISDEVIRGEIDKAIAEVENALLKIWVEPMRFATEPYFSEGGYDRKVESLAYYANDFTSNALVWHLNLPLQQVIKVDKISGYIGNTVALQLGNMAFTANRKAGTVDVLPYNSQYAYLYTFFVQLSMWGVRDVIAGFWRYSGVAGIEKMDGDILKLIGFIAAIPILTVAGQAYRGGLANEATSKDGVSVSRGYTNTASLGIYTATIKEYKEWIDKNLKRLRNEYRGIPMVVI